MKILKNIFGQTLKLIWDPLIFLLKIWDPLFFYPNIWDPLKNTPGGYSQSIMSNFNRFIEFVEVSQQHKHKMLKRFVKWKDFFQNPV